MIPQTSTTQQHSRHISEWTQGSAVSEAIARLNIESLPAAEMNQRVYGHQNPKNPIKHGGWWCRGVNWRSGQPLGASAGQGKPDQPHTTAKGESKYLAGQGTLDAMFLAMPDVGYWEKAYNESEEKYHLTGEKTILLWTEGLKKAACGLTLGFATICLAGVWNWKKGGEDKVGFEVENWMKPWFEHYLAFDSDYQSKENCRLAITRFAEFFKKKGCSLKILQWDTEYKGMDDYVKAKGQRQFFNEIHKAKAVAAWERQFNKTDDRKRDQPPSPRQTGLEIAEQYQPLWAFHNEQKLWRFYNGRFWEEIEQDAFGQQVFNVVESMNIQWKTPTYIENVMKVLRYKLLVPKWKSYDRNLYIAFNDGVLNLETGEILEHSPGFRFTSCLPYNAPRIPESINQDALSLLQERCPQTYNYMMNCQNSDTKRVLKLLAIINGLIKFKFHDLQMFVHLIGKPGSGKGTFARLCQKIVGVDNYIGSSLTRLDSSEYAIASIINKQLVVCPDERRQAGVEAILQLTGGDSVNYREIYKSPASSPFLGLLIAISNDPIFAGNTTGIDRRLCLVSFDNPVTSHLRTSNLEKLLEGEIPNLISVALQIPDLKVTELIKGIGESEIAEFKLKEWMMKLDTSSIARFVNDCLIYNPQDEIKMGDERTSKDYALYACYRDYCDRTGDNHPFKLRGFAENLVKLCGDYLGWNIEKVRRSGGIFYKGLRLRTDGDMEPTLEESLQEKAIADTRNTHPNEQCEQLSEGLSEGLSEQLNPLQDKDCEQCEQLNAVSSPVLNSPSEELRSPTSAIADNQHQVAKRKSKFAKGDRLQVLVDPIVVIGSAPISRPEDSLLLVGNRTVLFVAPATSPGFAIVEVEGLGQYEVSELKLIRWQPPQPEYIQPELLNDGNS